MMCGLEGVGVRKTESLVEKETEGVNQGKEGERGFKKKRGRKSQGRQQLSCC